MPDCFSVSTLDREALLHNVLETIIRELHYDRVIISFYDRHRHVARDFRARGVSEEIATLPVRVRFLSRTYQL